MMKTVEGCLANKYCRATLEVAKWAPVFFVAALTSWAYYAFVYEFCLMLIKDLYQRAAYLVAFHVLLALFLWAYVQVVFTPARRPPSKLATPLSSTCLLLCWTSFVLLTATSNSGVRFCIRCECVKPDRSHHCSTCGYCVLKFDHHCPWVNNCISYSNYKQFVLFLGYGFYLCVFAVFAMLPIVLELGRGDSGASFHQYSDGFSKFQVLLLFIDAAVFGISMGFLFFYHLFLTARNKSTVETYQAPIFTHKSDKRAYSLGVKRNFQQIFGSNWLLWMLPVFSSPGDGCHFPLSAT